MDSFSKVRCIVAIFAALLCCRLCVYGQSSTTVQLYFDQGSDAIIENDNLYSLNSVINTTRKEISRIVVVGYCSPEGGVATNADLARSRGERVRRYLIDKLGIVDSLIVVESGGVSWSRLTEFVEQENASYSGDVIAIIEREPYNSRNPKFMALDGGRSYKRLYNDIYPKLRSADVVVNYKRITTTTKPPQTLRPKRTTPQRRETTTIVDWEIAEPQSKPLFALKTNLLCDVMSLLNLEVEVPIKDRWSVCGEYMFAWWMAYNRNDNNSCQDRLQVVSATLEGRYWWGDRVNRPILTGWFTGLYYGVGIYDAELRGKGYQGDIYFSVGASGGYAHIIRGNRKLRMEYSACVGYFSTDYKYYYAQYCTNDRWHAVEQRSGRYHWVGPTRLKVSLSWLINKKSRE